MSHKAHHALYYSFIIKLFLAINNAGHRHLRRFHIVLKEGLFLDLKKIALFISYDSFSIKKINSTLSSGFINNHNIFLFRIAIAVY